VQLVNIEDLTPESLLSYSGDLAGIQVPAQTIAGMTFFFDPTLFRINKTFRPDDPVNLSEFFGRDIPKK